MQKRYIAFILAILMLVSCFSGCGGNEINNNVETTAKPEITTVKQYDDNSFKLSYTQADSLDPFKCASQNNQVLASLVFEPLFDINESYEATPNIATGYTFTDSKTLKVDINTNLKFSNGRSITIDDVLYSSKAALKSKAYSSALSCIKSVYSEGNSIYFNLRYANPYAVNLLSFPIASCKDDKNGFPVGSGRYRYSKKDGDTVLTANKTDDFNPYFTTISLVNIAAQDSIDNAVNIGNISFAFRDMSTDTSKRFSCNKKMVAMNNLVYIGINSYSGITSNSNIRKAINLAVDREALAENAYSGYANPATSTFNPDFKGIDEIKLFSVNADISSAKQAVYQSGYDDSKLNIRILVNNNANKVAVANLIKSQLELVGFRVTIDRQNQKNYIKKITDTNFDIYIGEVKLSDDMSLYPFFSSNGGVRYGVNGKKFTCDNLYFGFLSGNNELGKFILAFNDEMPYVPLIYRKGMLCYSKALNGDIQGYNGNLFSNIDTWNYN